MCARAGRGHSQAVLGEGPVELGLLARVERGEVGGLEVPCAAAAGGVQLVAADAKELAGAARARDVPGAAASGGVL